MTYLEKVKASKGLLETIQSLKDGESVKVTYGKDYNGEPKRFRIRCSVSKYIGTSYSIHREDYFSMDGMNIDKFTGTTAKAYTYDMMNQRTTYNFPLYEMKIVEQEGE